ncbi:hypothetical protein [Enterovibrio norvegicus]|uniref:hypothetical protein n=1 Tax=Enterovibrio norvegicus TaxID=188144 RepID=UPI00389A47C6
MTNLHELQCEACRADAPRVEQDEASTLQASIPDWELITVDGIDQLHREDSHLKKTVLVLRSVTGSNLGV